jgi:Flp pilus assembly protein TadG
MVEFALVLPILLTVVTMIVQAGIAYNHYLSLTDAVRAGARVAAVSRSATDPTTTTKNAVIASGNGLGLTATQVTVTPAAVNPWQTGTTVTVSAQTPYKLSIFGIPVKSGVLTSTTTERVE